MAEIERAHVDATNVLRTRFRTGSGVVPLTGFVPAASEEEKRRMLCPVHELVRRVECEQGEVEVHVDYDLRPDYGRTGATIRDAGAPGLRIETGARLVTLRSGVKLTPVAAGGVSGTVRLRAGEAVAFSLTDAWDGPAVLPPFGDRVLQKLALTDSANSIRSLRGTDRLARSPSAGPILGVWRKSRNWPRPVKVREASRMPFALGSIPRLLLPQPQSLHCLDRCFEGHKRLVVSGHREPDVRVPHEQLPHVGRDAGLPEHHVRGHPQRVEVGVPQRGPVRDARQLQVGPHEPRRRLRDVEERVVRSLAGVRDPPG